MKKLICMAAMFLAGAAAVFALPDFGLSVGGGGILGGHFTRYSLEADGPAARMSARQTMNQFDYGVFAFFDATFATLGITFQTGTNNFNESVYVDGTWNPDESRSGQGWETVLGISLLGRWPFRLNDRLTVFPLLGMDYLISLLQRRTDGYGLVYSRDDGLREGDKDGNAFSLSDWNSFIVRLGGGAEFDMTERFFLRGDLLFGIRLMTRYERKNLDFMKDNSGDSSPNLGGLSFGPSVRLSAGWRLR
ncbi:MAG: hypothetical protein FWD88_07320 [Treponema sp.]|nr:hypothetical protein [Treponema sp.]